MARFRIRSTTPSRTRCWRRAPGSRPQPRRMGRDSLRRMRQSDSVVATFLNREFDVRPEVSANMGDIFEGGTDLTVLPCGAKPTWTAAVDRWIDQFGIPTPKQLADKLRLSDVTAIAPFPGPQRITRFIAYAASVCNDKTSEDAVRKIGQRIGAITLSRSDIRMVECVLFGTGHGRLDDPTAARALARGFRETAHAEAALRINVHGHERYLVVQRAIASGFWRRLLAAIQLNPNFMGLGVNVKKLFGLEK
jgi:hypothetical protein